MMSLQTRAACWQTIDRLIDKEPKHAALSIRTYATSEIQIRLTENISTLLRRDIGKAQAALVRKRSAQFSTNRISQTDVETGEIKGKTRLRKFTSKARHSIREALSIMDYRWGKRCWAITVTLPGSTVQAVETLAKYDKEIRNGFLQIIRKVYSRFGKSGSFRADYVMVSELQKRGAIHLHAVVAWHSKKFARAIRLCARAWWIGLLQHYSDKTGVDMFQRVDGGTWINNPPSFCCKVQAIKKSVRGYLAKYLSKDASKCAQPGINSPSRWWSISSSIRDEMKKQRRSNTAYFETYDEASERAACIVERMEQQGLEFKVMRNPFTHRVIGYICFFDNHNSGPFFEWMSLLLEEEKYKISDNHKYAWEFL